MAREIELKLAVAPRELAVLERCAWLRRHGSARTRARLYTVYYDTPDGALWTQGVTLRLRRSGRRWIQAVKWGGGVSGGVHEHGEFECEVRGACIDYGAITDPALIEVFAAPGLRAQLVPVFVTDFERRTVQVAPAPDSAIEVSFDRGSVKCGDRAEVLSEIELELKAGPAWHLYDAALALAAGTRFCIELRSKAGRGFALLGTAPERPVKSVASGVTPDLDVHAAFRAIVLACLTQFQMNQHGMLAGDDHEFLHQMRVALRRMRSAFTLFRPVLPAAHAAGPLAELRRLGGILGAARDWDVFETERLPGVVRRFEGHLALGALVRAARATRQARGTVARRTVAGVRCQRFQLELAGGLLSGAWMAACDADARRVLETPVLPFARRVLTARMEKARKRARRLGERSDAELHALRIAVKKVRYAAEFFAPLFDAGRAKAFRDAASALQDALGLVNDAAVMMPLLAQAGLSRGPLREACAWVVRSSRIEARREKQALPSLWRRFSRGAGYWS